MSATWYKAGEVVIDTGVDDPAWPSSGYVGYSYAAKVRAKVVYLGPGSDAPVSYRWAFSTRIMISTPVTFSAQNQSQTITNAARRVYIIVDAWTDKVPGSGSSQMQVKELEWRLERLT